MSLDRRALVQLARLFLLADGVSGVVGMAGEDGKDRKLTAGLLLGAYTSGQRFGGKLGASRVEQDEPGAGAGPVTSKRVEEGLLGPEELRFRGRVGSQTFRVVCEQSLRRSGAGSLGNRGEQQLHR